MRKILMVVLFVSWRYAIAQEYSTNATKDYATDLGQVYGAIRSVEHMKEICIEAFPKHQNDINAAYRQWRESYKSFLEEIENYIKNMMLQKANGNRKKYALISAAADKEFAKLRGNLKIKMMSKGAESFSEQCMFYSSYVALPRLNLESYYGKQMVVIRKGQQPPFNGK